ncbi:hypothetical protein EDC01DRAFT_751466 [Geopyxis carbonaria]|nr:hypothetical protein EDC01DRAFT_751466 [Geopyxis carbonaria]
MSAAPQAPVPAAAAPTLQPFHAPPASLLASLPPALAASLVTMTSTPLTAPPPTAAGPALILDPDVTFILAMHTTMQVMRLHNTFTPALLSAMFGSPAAAVTQITRTHLQLADAAVPAALRSAGDNIFLHALCLIPPVEAWFRAHTGLDVYAVFKAVDARIARVATRVAAHAPAAALADCVALARLREVRAQVYAFFRSCIDAIPSMREHYEKIEQMDEIWARLAGALEAARVRLGLGGAAVTVQATVRALRERSGGGTVSEEEVRREGLWVDFDVGREERFWWEEEGLRIDAEAIFRDVEEADGGGL